MEIRLGMTCTAEQILDAFKKAGASLENCATEESIGEPVCKSTGQVSRTGARAHFYYRGKKFGFFGPIVSKKADLNFVMTPILEDEKHCQIEITPHFVYGCNLDVTEIYTCSNPDEPEFAPVRHYWDEFVKEFFANLPKE